MDGSKVAFYEQCTKMCWTGTMAGQRIPENQNCPIQNIGGGGTAQTYVYTCWNGQVVQTSSQCPVQNQTCPNGSVIPVSSQCPAATQTCWNGSTIPAVQSCPTQTKVCLSGSVVNINAQCTKSCPNGAIINESQTCPAQTKICRDGRVVGMSSECTRSCPDGSSVNEVYNCPAIIRKDHSIITTAVTQVNQNSARCNGISVIERGLNSVGYFEYGTSPSLTGNSLTNSGNIGANPSVSFANTINGLKPDTTYYCRAVMNNVDGTYKGQIVSFRTLAEEVKYVAPVQERIQEIRTIVKKETVTTTTNTNNTASSKLTIAKNTVKKVVTKPSVTCKDSSGNTSELGLDDKFVKINLEKLTSQVSAGKEVKYNLSYKNTSNLNLENGVVKITIPAEMEYVSSKMGEYDKNTNTLLIDLGNIKAGEQDAFDIVLKVKEGVQIGKTLVVSSLVSYEMLDENGKSISDENTTYDISTVSEYTKDQSVVADKKNQAKEDVGFFGGWLFKTLVSIILFIILFILGKNIYNKIRERRYQNMVLGNSDHNSHHDFHAAPNTHH
jgi:uncharacterized repeat protein (TIGR01451 family)